MKGWRQVPGTRTLEPITPLPRPPVKAIGSKAAWVARQLQLAQAWRAAVDAELGTASHDSDQPVIRIRP